MGMDFIAAWGWLSGERDLDYDKALAVIDTLDDKELEDFDMQATGGEGDFDAVEVSDSLRRHIQMLQDSWDRATLMFPTPDKSWTLVIAGGSSYGDDPNEGFTAMSNLQYAPTVFQALGFFWHFSGSEA